MNNKRLAEIIKDPGIATDKEVKQINTYSEEYSYTPFLKVLQARLDHLHNVKDKAKSLTKAAIYIADRSILKDFITNDQLSVASTEDIPTQTKTIKEKKPDESAVAIDTEDKSRDEDAPVKDESVVLEDKIKEEVKEKEAEVLSEEEVDLGRKEEKDGEPVADTKKKKDVNAETEQEEKKDLKAAKGKKKKKDIGDQAEKEESKDAEPVKYEKVMPDTESEIGSAETSVADIESGKIPEVEVTEKEVEKPEEKAEEKQKASMEEQKEKAAVEDQKKENNQEALRQEAEPLDEIDRNIQASEDSEKSSSLSKEIMENISELKKHKASLLNLLNIDSGDKKSASDSKPGKASKKEKSKKKESHKDKKEDLSTKAIKPEQVDPKASQIIDNPENQNYPDYEEEDPIVIKDFLTRLEESNPPPKKKLKKEEQEKLIEKFIQSDPQMQNVRSSKELTEKKDLSAPSVKFRDDIISENLACIMIKQGKHEKAIDIYKKLIWKFPQKKTYFATQIEELKKKLKK